MQINQMKERLGRVEQCASSAQQACQSATGVPQELQQCVSELDRRSHEAMQWVQGSQDEQRIVQCVDDLERIGDRAMAACKQADGIDPQVKSAVRQAHDELSSLKHQLH